jgi:hypothetical protein
MSKKYAMRWAGEFQQFCGVRLKPDWRAKRYGERDFRSVLDDPPWKPENSVTLVAVGKRFAEIEAKNAPARDLRLPGV